MYSWVYNNELEMKDRFQINKRNNWKPLDSRILEKNDEKISKGKGAVCSRRY